MNPKEKTYLEYAVSAYGFVIPFNTEISFHDFATRIQETFDCKDNPRNHFIVNFLNNLDGKVSRTINDFSVKISKKGGLK